MKVVTSTDAALQLLTDIRSRCQYWLGRTSEVGEPEAKLEAVQVVAREDFESDLDYLLDLSNKAIEDLSHPQNI